jgi:hypothetical protein
MLCEHASSGALTLAINQEAACLVPPFGCESCAGVLIHQKQYQYEGQP